MRAVLPSVVVIALLAGCGGNSLTQPTAQPASSTPPTPVVTNPVPASPGVPQTFVGAGDIAACDGNSEATARLLDGIGGTVFTLGDNAYFHGSDQNFRECYDPTWGRHKSRTRPIPGNHDYETAGAASYFAYFGDAAGPAGLGYYSFEIGSWHAVALNSNIPASAGSAQAAWLANDLANHPTKCTIAYFHHPLFTSGPDGPSPFMQEAWRLLYAAGAEIIMNGHEHMYERFAPQTPDGTPDPTNGIREFISGTGGAPLYQPVGVRPNSEVRISTFGVLKLTLTSSGYSWEFVPVSGGSDFGSGNCH
jgi:hypothetical protein